MRDICVYDFIEMPNYYVCYSGWYNYIYKFDKNLNVTDTFRIPYGTPFTLESVKFMFYYDKLVYLVSNVEKKVLTFNLSTNEFEEYENCDLCNMKRISDIKGDVVYGVVETENVIYEYNLKERCMHKYMGDDLSKGYVCVQVIDDILILVRADGTKIDIYSLENQKLMKSINFPDDCEIGIKEYSFSTMVALSESKVLLFPQYVSMAVEVDINEGKAEQYLIDYQNPPYDRGQIFTCAHRIGDIIFAFSEWKREWSFIDINNKKITHKKSYMSEECEKIVFGEAWFHNPYGSKDLYLLYEKTDYFTLNNFIKELIK